MPFFSTPARPALALLVAATSLTLAAAGPADAARKGKSKGRADLTVRELHVDVTDAGTLHLTGSVLNLGRKFARPSDLVIALSSDATFDDADDVLDEVHFLRLPSGVKRSVDADVEIPLDADASGALSILVCADGYDDIRERDEHNNCATQTVVIDDLAGDQAADDPADDGSDASADDPADDEG